MGLVKAHYKDSVNFKDPQTKDWDLLPSWSVRKLLTRVDSKGYIDQLEKLVKKLNGSSQLKGIKSEFKYLKRDLKL
jgi:hypothetical protein